MKADPKVLDEMLKAFNSRRDLVISSLNKINGVKTNVPEGAFYVFPDISSFFGKSVAGKTIKTSEDLAMYLLDDALVALVSGEAFGDPNCIRISYAASEETLIEAMKRIKVSLEKLNV